MSKSRVTLVQGIQTLHVATVGTKLENRKIIGVMVDTSMVLIMYKRCCQEGTFFTKDLSREKLKTKTIVIPSKYYGAFKFGIRYFVVITASYKNNCRLGEDAEISKENNQEVGAACLLGTWLFGKENLHAGGT